ncbi:transporter [Opitutaceae bacterium EW11]|nr:transporter [Opitutaceae bacterium EW11]
MNTHCSRFSGLLVVALFTGCASTARRPAAVVTEAPPRWLHAIAADAPVAGPNWWDSFGSDELRQFVRQADSRNLDLTSAVARVRQAQANAMMARAGLFPSLVGSAGAEHRNLPSASSVERENNYSVALNASYEIDFWGGNRAARDSARHALRASQFELETVRMTVTAGTASLWLQAVGLRERVSLAEKSTANAERVLGIVEARVASGAATKLDLAQQRGLVAAQRRAALALQQQSDEAVIALARLLGQPVSELSLRTASLRSLRVPLPTPVMPSVLLTRRPDIARAEAQLAGAEADVASARAAMFPRLNLSGGVGASGGRLRSLVDNPAYSVAAGLTAPIFSAGRLVAGKELAQARREELLVAYRATILSAFSDVETALNAVASLSDQTASQAEQQMQATRALALAEIRYRAGAETLLTLLEAQRAVYAAEDAWAQLLLDRLLASVSLYRALGGGWTVPTTPAESGSSYVRSPARKLAEGADKAACANRLDTR